MKIVIPKERRPYEARVAASPETVKKYIALGCKVMMEEKAGLGASIPDVLYQEAGAKIIKSLPELYKEATVILKVQRPEESEFAHYPKGSTLISTLNILTHPQEMKVYSKAGLSALALELMPRITRAQTMDVLSSQSNLAGYRAVIEAATLFDRAFPMMMTAAGTILPAKVLVIGAGVAGLQAIATARRLGAVVLGYDVRSAAKEQVESLGATFVEVDRESDAETKAGYAQEMDEDYKIRQAEKLHETLKKVDIVITTALIPGRPAPRLITERMIQDMKPGSVIIDMAVEAGGNCQFSEIGKMIQKHNVKIMGAAHLPCLIARDASDLYARNVFNVFKLLYDESTKALKFDLKDEIIQSILLTYEGEILRQDLLPTVSSSKSSSIKRKKS